MNISSVTNLLTAQAQAGQLLALPSAVRLFIMLSFSVYVVILTNDGARSFTLFKKSTLRAIYLALLVADFILLTIARTPLLNEPAAKVLFLVSGYLLLAVAAVGSVYYIQAKKLIGIADTAFMLANLPVFFEIGGWRYVYVLSVGYAFVRIVVFAIGRSFFYKNEPSGYMVRQGFDSLDQGILFANSYGQISFINKAMRQYFKRLGIDEYVRTNKICEKIENLASENGGRVSNTSAMVLVDGEYLVFSWIKKQKVVEQISCRNVTDEELILLELNKSRENEKKIQAELEETIKKVEAVETQKEILKIKGNLHDVMAQRLSILHGIVNYGGFDDVDLKKIKELIAGMMPEMYGGFEVSLQDRIKELVNSFALIGVELRVSKQLYTMSNKTPVLKVLRECTTNAVRHGGATVVTADAEITTDGCKLTVTDNGRSCKDVIYGNGLFGIGYAVEAAGGYMHVETEPSFAVTVFFPNKK